MRTKIKLYLDWIINVQFAGLVMAMENHDYEQRGIDLEIIPWDGKALVTDYLLEKSDEIRLATVEDNLLVKDINMGKPLQAVATMMQSSPIGLMAKKNKFPSFPEELRDKKLAVHIDGLAMIGLLMKKVGLEQTSLDIVTVGADWLDDFVSDKVDLMQCYAMLEPISVRQMGFEVDVFPACEWGYDVYSQVIVSRRDLQIQHQSIINDFLEVTFEGWKKAFSEPEKIVSLLVEQYHQSEPFDVQVKMLHELKKWIFDFKKGYFQGEMEWEKWKAILSIYHNMGYIDKLIDPMDIVPTTQLQ